MCVARRFRWRALHRLGPADDAGRRVDAGARRRRGRADHVGEPRRRGSQVAAGLTAAVFTTLAVIAIVWGAAHVVVGVPLRRHRAVGAPLALMLGSVDLLLLPYGTALGVYALWVLLSEKGRGSSRQARCFGLSISNSLSGIRIRIDVGSLMAHRRARRRPRAAAAMRRERPPAAADDPVARDHDSRHSGCTSA